MGSCVHHTTCSSACAPGGLLYQAAAQLQFTAKAPPNNSFKPNLLRSGNSVAERACHAVASTTQVGLTQALGLMDTKKSSLVFLAALAVVNGVATQYPDPYNPPEPVSVALTILAAAAIFVWYRADAIARTYRRSPILNVAVFGLAAVSLPYYFVRSRGWKGGLISTAGAIGTFVGFCLVSGLSAMATVWASNAFGPIG